jgi:hypothetical protein
MNKVKNYGLIVLVVLFTALLIESAIQTAKIKKQKTEIERVKNNYKVAQDSMKQIKGENNLYASRIEKQDLTIEELKSYYSNLVADVRDMKIQLRKVAGITAFNTETTNNINTLFKDSLRIDSVTVQTLSYSDQWFDISIVKEGLKAKINAISRDSLIQVVHWERSGVFWPTRFLTKKVYFQDIKSMNPGSRITYSKWIVPIKR